MYQVFCAVSPVSYSFLKWCKACKLPPDAGRQLSADERISSSQHLVPDRWEATRINSEWLGLILWATRHVRCFVSRGLAMWSSQSVGDLVHYLVCEKVWGAFSIGKKANRPVLNKFTLPFHDFSTKLLVGRKVLHFFLPLGSFKKKSMLGLYSKKSPIYQLSL